MTAAEHYREAEKILATHRRLVADATPNTIDEIIEAAPFALAEAQIHATLAHAGAIILAERGTGTTAANDLFDAVTEKASG